MTDIKQQTKLVKTTGTCSQSLWSQGWLSARATTTVKRLSAHLPQTFLLFFNCSVTPLCLAKYCFMRAVCLPDAFVFCRRDAQWGGGQQWGTNCRGGGGLTVGYKLKQGGPMGG